jgi:hypothetical protein
MKKPSNRGLTLDRETVKKLAVELSRDQSVILINISLDC